MQRLALTLLVAIAVATAGCDRAATVDAQAAKQGAATPVTTGGSKAGDFGPPQG